MGVSDEAATRELETSWTAVVRAIYCGEWHFSDEVSQRLKKLQWAMGHQDRAGTSTPTPFPAECSGLVWEALEDIKVIAKKDLKHKWR